jgi:hypothetical protein
MVSCVSACIAELLGDLSKKPTRIRSISIGVLISTRVAADTKRISVSPGVRIHYPDYELGVVTWGFFPDESDWSGILTYQILGVIFLTTMALVLLAAVSYQCAATWKWIRDKTCGDPSDESAITKQQAAIRISHSLPDLQTEPLTQQYVQEHKDVVAKKVQIERNIGGVDLFGRGVGEDLVLFLAGAAPDHAAHRAHAPPDLPETAVAPSGHALQRPVQHLHPGAPERLQYRGVDQGRQC